MASGTARQGFLGATKHLWILCGIIGIGWATGAGAGAGGLSGSSLYLFFTTLLLAVGLYGSTSGISLREAREDLGLLLLAVTVGVVAKAALIALVLWFVLDEPAYLILAVAVAQIDPLSVAALRDSSLMSPRGKAVLSVWASFDDPVTVLLTAYTAPIALSALRDTPATGGTAAAFGGDLLGYAAQLGWNAAIVAAAAAVWLLLRRAWGKDPSLWSRTAQIVAVLLLLVLVVAAAGFTLMLGIAVVGLFFRPAALQRHLGTITRGAYAAAAFTLGLLLVGGIDLVHGLVLGAAAYGAQIVVGSLLARNLDRVDRVSLALGQQNGVTAVILALSLQPMFPKAVAIIAPAVVTVNCLHFVANSLWNRSNRSRADIPDPHPAPLNGRTEPLPPALPVLASVVPWKRQEVVGDPRWKECVAVTATFNFGGLAATREPATAHPHHERFPTAPLGHVQRGVIVQSHWWRWGVGDLDRRPGGMTGSIRNVSVVDVTTHEVVQERD
ncbi:hypothetical protein [Streptomyces sp. NPDC050704]|uniref:hypothetical protein n=1 Tax=Streptomyces sp. NPDC050704 TaxID=3157219 RepID=UPI00343F9240